VIAVGWLALLLGVAVVLIAMAPTFPKAGIWPVVTAAVLGGVVIVLSIVRIAD